MKITILGTGNMGSGLASALVAAGHDISIGARDPVKAVALAETLGHGVVGGDIATASKRSDIIILALPFGAIAEVIAQIGEVAGKVLVDISNPISPDYKELIIGHTTSAAEEIQKLAPQARVVKAFNTIFAQLLAPESRQDRVVQVFIAGDDETAKSLVTTLVESIHFAAMEAGPLANSRYLEPVGEMNIHFGYFLGQGPLVAPSWA